MQILHAVHLKIYLNEKSRWASAQGMMHVPMMHLRVMHVPVMHVALIFDPDACMYDAFIYDLDL